MPITRRKSTEAKKGARITAWSYSRLSTYDPEQGGCPRKAMFLYVMRLPQVENAAMQKGKEAHSEGESFLLDHKSSHPKHPSWEGWEDELFRIREEGYKPEQRYAFTERWKAVDWFARTAWARMMVDAVSPPGKMVTAIDYKTGRPYHTHAEQAELYALAVHLAYRNAAEFLVEFWYLDDQDVVTYDFVKKEMNDIREKWEARAITMCSDTEFEPNPGPKTCGKFGGCEFAANRGGQCTFNTQGQKAK